MPDINPKPNTQKIKIESNEGKVPEAIKDLKFNIEQLPTLSVDEGYVPENEPKEEQKPTEKEPEFKVVEKEPIEEPTEEASKEEVISNKETEKEELPKEEEGIDRFLKPPKGSEAEKQAIIKKGSKDTFDYSQYDAEETFILKNMPVAGREKVGKLFKEAKDKSKSKENQFYQSPEGYLLHPGYRTEVANINLAEKEARIWSKMLKEAKEGVAVKLLEGWRNGEPVFGAEVKATDELEEVIRNNFNQCLAIASEKRNAVNNFVKNFPTLAAKDMSLIKEERTKRFAWVADPKLLDYSIAIEGVGDKPIRQVKSDVASLFPAYMRNNEAVEACGDLMVALMIAKAELYESKKGKKVELVKKDEEKSIEPGGDIRPKKTSQSVHGVKHFSTEGAGIEI